MSVTCPSRYPKATFYLSLPRFNNVLKFTVGDLLESIDEFGVWCVSRIEEVAETHVCVSFPEWPREFDRKIVDGEEIRQKHLFHQEIGSVDMLTH